MAKYKDTLNLPNTKFPMKANLAQREPEMLKRWQAVDIYQHLRQQRAGQEQYILHDGPPYANGKIHLGHAVNKTLKDMVVKSHTLDGYDAPYVPGWDCHGLPIEVNVEKKIGRVGQKVSATEFRQACRNYAQSQVDQQSQDFQRLGVFGDWQNPYLTMNFNYEANVIRALRDIIDQGHLQQGFKPVHWCFDCRSSLAEAEVEYQDKQSFSIDVKFTAVDQAAVIDAFGAGDNGEGEISFVIWTTTPWTLPANRAVALNAELDYALVQINGERLIVAAAMLDDVMQRYQIENYQSLATVKGAALEGLQLQHPFYDRQVPVVLGDHVTIDAGTGAVHTAPSHGEDDYRIGVNYNLPMETYVLANGVYNDQVELFAGQHINKANPEIIALLDQNQKLVQQSKIEHSYPHCWRHKTPVIFRATPQWFISMAKQQLEQQALAACEQVQWLPEWGEKRMTNMLADRPDWCISRQRTWGVPIPLFIHQATNELHPDTINIMSRVAELVEQQGIEAWYQVDAHDLIGADADEYTKLNDVLDVWFDSGVSHYTVLEARDNLRYPADVYLEGSDQYRGWFQTSLLTSVAMNGISPYKTNITHGFTVDEHGHKMSKSLGNTIEPEKICKTLGADILRLWIANTDYSAEMTASDEILKRTSDLYRRMRNTARFLLSNLHDFIPEQHSIAFEEMLPLDRWAVDHAARLQQEIIVDYQNFQFHKVVQKIHHFCAIELGGFYLDIIKDRQYTCQTDGLSRRSAQTAMYLVLEALVRWIAPILVFTSDEIWQYLPGEREQSVHLATWFDGLNTTTEDDVFNHTYWQIIMDVRNTVNEQLEFARKQEQIGSALEAEVLLRVNPTLKAMLDQLGDELRFVLITSNVTVELLPEAEQDIEVQVTASTQPKCARCWHRRHDVGQDKRHPEICLRCVKNIEGDGEQRHFA